MVPVSYSGWPSLTGLANYTAAVLMLQVALGAAVGHNLLAVLWHMLGAAAVVIFGVGMAVIITQVPGSKPLRAAPIWLVCLLGVQVTLGMALISIPQPSRPLAGIGHYPRGHAAVWARRHWWE